MTICPGGAEPPTMINDPAYVLAVRKARTANTAAIRLAGEYSAALNPSRPAPGPVTEAIKARWDAQHIRAIHLRQQRMILGMALYVLYHAVMPQFPAESEDTRSRLEQDITHAVHDYLSANLT